VKNLNKEEIRESVTPLAAGLYWVGDPCYVVPDQHWLPWLEDAWEGADGNRVVIMDGRVEGRRIVASGTAHGDGSYFDQFGREYPVDAGLIGAVHAAFWPEHAAKKAEHLGMHLVEFDRPFTVSFDEDGTIHVGHLRIPTDWDPQDGEVCQDHGTLLDYDGGCEACEELA
jgi:hypothetical protein